MVRDSERKVKTIDELSNVLKEIYDLAKNEKMTRKDIKQKYNISIPALANLVDIDRDRLEPEGLKTIVETLKKTNAVNKTGAELAIGNDILSFIKRNIGLEYDKKIHENEHYERFYKETQKIWIEVAKGRKLEDVSKMSKMKIEDTEEIFCRYSDLINLLQKRYKKSRTKSMTLENYQRKYFLDEYIIDYIKCGQKNEFIENTLNPIIDRKCGFLKGGEHEQ